jgi:redox-sensitive bicupin YhaK (pirin superfamily)
MRSRWHFSFDRYYDPENMGIGKLRVFSDDVPGAAWPLHPHRDVESITYVVSGTFRHADSLGNDGVLAAGGVQRMTLGSGAWHSEQNHSQTEEVRFIQMWIMPAQRGLPLLSSAPVSLDDRHNRLLEVLGPVDAPGELVHVHQQAAVYLSRLDAGSSIAHEFRRDRVGYFYLVSGEAEVNGERLSTGDSAKVLGAGQLAVRAVETANDPRRDINVARF